MTEPLLPSASRRDFLRAGAGAATLAALAPRSFAAEPDTTADVIRELIRFNDQRIPAPKRIASSISPVVATPSLTRCSDSRHMASSSRSAMKPGTSLRTCSGRMPKDR